MFKLRTSLAIRSDCSPIIIPQNIFISSLIHHGFNSEHVALFHKPGRFVALIMWDIRGAMKQTSHPMTCIGSHHWKALFLDVFPNHVANFPVHDSGLADRNGQFQGPISLLDQKPGRLGNFADGESFIEIGMEPIFIGGNIHITNVSGLQGSVIRDTVTNHLIDGSAAGLGELVVVEWRGVALVVQMELMHFLVYKVSGHACSNDLVRAV